MFDENRTSYSDLSVKKSANDKNFYIMFENNLSAGYICANSSENICNVCYAKSFGREKFFRRLQKNLVEKNISCLSVKDYKLAAYYLATSPDGKSVVVEQIVVAKKYLNSGAMLPLWNKFIHALYLRQCENLIFAVYSQNLSAIKFDVKITKNLQLTTNIIHKYLFQKNGNF